MPKHKLRTVVSQRTRKQAKQTTKSVRPTVNGYLSTDAKRHRNGFDRKLQGFAPLREPVYHKWPRKAATGFSSTERAGPSPCPYSGVQPALMAYPGLNSFHVMEEGMGQDPDIDAFAIRPDPDLGAIIR